jgi:catechol 2,3-dioxygenase-like lactoylglutathione lyase family enzyme
MIGDFHELSVSSGDILESIAFWERLGFAQARAGDAWQHPYAVLTDGRLTLGLHRYEFASPSLTFVRPGLRELVPRLEALGVELEFLKLGSEHFNELGFLDPDGQMICLLEARTYSAVPEPAGGSRLGWFGEYRMPVRSVEESARFWADLGLFDAEHARAEDARLICCTGMNLGAHEDRKLRAPALAFYDDGMAARVERLAEAQLEFRKVVRDRDGAFARAELRSPEGLDILLIEGHL